MYSFPLYKNDGTPCIALDDTQREALRVLLDKIHSGTYARVSNACLCGNAETDLVVSEKDRYGIPIPSILCRYCGILRSGWVFDAASNRAFYENEYRKIYTGEKTSLGTVFAEQSRRGERLMRIWCDHARPDPHSIVFESGCGAGGILWPFHQAGMKCAGNDFYTNYIQYGQDRGLDIQYGDYRERIHDNTVDLFILSHVMEHFLHPFEEMCEVIKKVRPGKYLLVEVPGIFEIHKVYHRPILYLQNAHVYSFYLEALKVFFAALGLMMVYGDEHCTALLQKPENWSPREPANLRDEKLAPNFERIKKYLMQTYWQTNFGLNFYQHRQRMIRATKFIGLYQFMKKFKS